MKKFLIDTSIGFTIISLITLLIYALIRFEYFASGCWILLASCITGWTLRHGVMEWREWGGHND